MSDFRIGIDPDTDKSGVALFNVKSKMVTGLYNKTFFELFGYLSDGKETDGVGIEVVIEAGWLNAKSNFHGAFGGAAERIGAKVGANHETGKKIAEMCEYLNIPYRLVKPLSLKVWGGKKINHAQFVQLTGWVGRTNQEQRDAAMLVIA